jgi:hypothetical protein
MALICHKTGFLGVDGVVHRHFCPFMNKKEALEREDSPLPEVPPLPIAAVVREGASVWTPLEDYFIPYFEHLNH